MTTLATTNGSPRPGMKTERQFGGFALGGGVGGGWWPDGLLPGAAGVTVNSIWPMWGSLLVGSYGTYRAMLRHPTIAYVVAQVTNPVVASSWKIDAEPDADEKYPEAVAWIHDNIILRRQQIVPHALRSIVFGNSPFEVVWSVVADRFVIDAFVPLLPDVTVVLRADGGRGEFAGLQNGTAILAPSECLYVKNDAEPGNDHGRSRLENIRDTAWPGWMSTAGKLEVLEDRVSGMVPIIIVPDGAPENGPIDPATNKPKTFLQLASDVLVSLTHPRSRGAVLATPSLSSTDGTGDPQKLKQLSTTVEPLNLGERAESQKAMLEKLAYWDDLMGRGLYRGERTLFATKGASRADSQQHSVNAEPDAECIDEMIAAAVNDGPVKTGMTLNFGAEILKVVRGIKPSPLVDRERIAASERSRTMLQNSQLAPVVIAGVDVEKDFNVAGIPTLDNCNQRIDAAMKAADAKASQATTKAP